jgi:antitoxin (DNA-binding transcriptional repressor) of toxin-antitoxin stability system
VGTVVGTVGTVVGNVTVTVSGRPVASTFATKKPDTAKQTSTTIALHLTTLISPSAKLPAPA